ncbi:MAG: hypothetical protein HY812_09915 [Planctomycetes bacterium]|nr:hypothetical protein [Planctomycetota bacterium]
MHHIVLLLFLLLGAAPQGPEPPYPSGSSAQEHAGLKFQLVMPEGYDAAKQYALFIVLHGYGGTETGMAGSFAVLAERDFVVCAPKSTAEGWDEGDLQKVKEIVHHLAKVLAIGPGRLHGLGFSNGGWNLAPLVFDEDFEFASACWMAAGFQGGSVPKRAKKALGAIALAGGDDPNRGAAEGTVGLLEGKVRSVECRIQPGLGHEFPDKLMPYYFYWLEVMDGRFTPGRDASFEWANDLDAARTRMTEEQLGGFVYFFAAADQENADARALQHEVFFDPLVRAFGEQLVAVMLERAEHEELFQEFRLKATPAVVVLKKDGKTAASFSGKIKAGALAKALRDQAKNKKAPER